MSNFKSGSGDLNFGDNGESDETDTETPEEQTSEQSVPGQASAGHSTETTTPAKKYPYFVRRKNVGDERDNRLEVHVRDKIASQESDFRNMLADHLDANEVTKTDAREFALLTAFHHPERVAELMENEGFNAFD